MLFPAVGFALLLNVQSVKAKFVPTFKWPINDASMAPGLKVNADPTLSFAVTPVTVSPSRLGQAVATLMPAPPFEEKIELRTVTSDTAEVLAMWRPLPPA